MGAHPERKFTKSTNWARQPAMPCEKHIYIAALIAFALMAPLIPWIYFLQIGFLPMPRTMFNLIEGGEAIITSSVVLWATFIVHIVLTFAFLIVHYCSCFYPPECCGQREGDPMEFFFLIRRFNHELYNYDDCKRNTDTAAEYYKD